MNAPYSKSERAAVLATPSNISLDDKYTLSAGKAYMNGSQALVKLMLLQAERDKLAGLNTAGFVSGYRGSPLGGLDQAFNQAKKHLAPANIKFQPGLNEDLGATSVWGSQQVNLFPGARHQGVFGMWYGKGPGVDRSIDVFKHANAAGTSQFGGVLAVVGDDHAAKSSTLPHQSDHVLKAAMMPVLFPSDLQEYLDMGLLGFAMSRYAGVWVGFKAIADTVESSSSVFVDANRVDIRIPKDIVLPDGGLNIRWPDTPLAQEARLLDHKLYAALAFARVNGINRTVIDSPNAKFGIVASGKAYLDTLQALRDLGLDDQACRELGIRVYKVGMVWPLEAVGIREFAKGLQEILVVEEKRQMIEYQIKEELYAWDAQVRPRVYGKFDERASGDGREGGEWSVPQGRWLLPTHYELNPALIAKAIARRLGRLELPADVRKRFSERLKDIRRHEEHARLRHPVVERKPYFCSGCPHNTSTKVPEGSRAMAGIGCHYMAVWMDRNTETFTQMGGEGTPWIGQAPFTDTPHVFTNLGDGTYFHSGILAIRASVAAGVNITYKLLYNDAVAMTGGQKLDGDLTVPQLTRQLAAENVSKIVLVTDNLDKYADVDPTDLFADGVQFFDRAELDAVQRSLREIAGTTVLIYEQTCASEKRRRRKRIDPSTGQPLYPDPNKRVVINERVCEGCGDCSKQSNCLSIEPLPTPLGTKRTINQSTCNKDYSCLQGLCPSLVTVEGAALKKQHGTVGLDELEKACSALTEPSPVDLATLSRPYGVLVDGVGGTGVVTIGAWLGMAAHIQGIDVKVLDMAGLAQKGGAVHSHVRFGVPSKAIASAKIPVGEADLLLGADTIVSANPATLALLDAKARVVINDDTLPTADMIHDRQWAVPVQLLASDLEAALDSPTQIRRFNALRVAEQLLGDTVYANAFLLGTAYQLGALPVSLSSIIRAVELNAVQVKRNVLALQLGRLAVADKQALSTLLLKNNQKPEDKTPTDKQGWMTFFERELTEYQNASYAKAYRERLSPVLAMDLSVAEFARVARAYYRLLAFKDEFEVARLLTDRTWQASVLSQYEEGASIKFHVAPEWLARGHENRRKWALGSAWQWALKLLVFFKPLRFSAINLFAKTEEAKQQRFLVAAFEQMLREWAGAKLAYPEVLRRLEAFESVKGFGQVRKQSFMGAINTLKQVDSTSESRSLSDYDDPRGKN